MTTLSGSSAASLDPIVIPLGLWVLSVVKVEEAAVGVRFARRERNGVFQVAVNL